MKTLDLLIIVPLLWGAYIGYKQGLLMSLVGILAFVLAVILGFKLMDTGLDLLKPYFSSSNRFLPYIAFAAIFFPIILLVNKLGQLLRKSIQYTLIGLVRQHGGALVGRVYVGLRGKRVPVAGVSRWASSCPRIPPTIRSSTPSGAPLRPGSHHQGSNLLPNGQDLPALPQSAIQNVQKDSCLIEWVISNYFMLAGNRHWKLRRGAGPGEGRRWRDVWRLKTLPGEPALAYE
jgi:membrane protein required for colicin V production